MTSEPKQDTKLSDCHNAPVVVAHGLGDFGDNERGITLHYECTVCHEACNFHEADRQQQSNKSSGEHKALRKLAQREPKDEELEFSGPDSLQIYELPEGLKDG